MKAKPKTALALLVGITIGIAGRTHPACEASTPTRLIPGK
jgi:hypothetical protein